MEVPAPFAGRVVEIKVAAGAGFYQAPGDGLSKWRALPRRCCRRLCCCPRQLPLLRLPPVPRDVNVRTSAVTKWK